MIVNGMPVLLARSHEIQLIMVEYPPWWTAKIIGLSSLESYRSKIGLVF